MENLKNIEDFHFIDEKKNYRYERKYTVPDRLSTRALEQIIKRNTFLFREIFHQRKVNNIYFDTENYKFYFDNVFGVSNRKKIRIRWYGDTFGKIAQPVLEIKIKNGLIGDKWSYRLKPFLLDEHFSNAYIQKIFKNSDLPLYVLETLQIVSPSLLNSYNRRYFLSADNRYRITMDFDLLYHKIGRNFNHFSRPVRDLIKVIELKYGLDNDNNASSVSTQFPFLLSKNSKYINGISVIKQFQQ